LEKYLRKNVRFVVERGTWTSYFQKQFTKDKPENLVAEQEIVRPQYLEELHRDFTIE
jgi:hypothetical protein